VIILYDGDLDRQTLILLVIWVILCIVTYF